jgi:hypothetical protein
VFRYHELHADPDLQNIHLASLIAAHLYGESDNEADRELAIRLFTKVVPSFYLGLHAAVARDFGDMKTAKQSDASISKIRAAGAGY